MKFIFAFALCIIGCASGSFDRLPRQDEAERIVWNELYGEDGEPPSVEWIDDWINYDQRIAGLTWPGWKVQVMRQDYSADGILHQFSDTTFAHELMHYHTFLRTGDVDAAHWRGDWELADKTAVRALRTLGL